MAARDDRDRFSALILLHMDAAYSLARYLARDPTAAEDIVQEAYLRAYRSFAGLRGDNPKAWLLMIVRRCFLDTISRKTILDGGDNDRVLEVASVAADPETVCAEQRRAAIVRDAVEALPGSYREAVVLREFEELSYQEIAIIVGMPIGTVMSRLFRARQMLAERLAPLRHEEPAPIEDTIVLNA